MVGARVPLEIVEEITEAVEAGFYLTPSHLIRKAIEQELYRLKGVGKKDG
jgi:Arc/MetJ-type ribon-helix-helix transcriptional regulator